jgi:hypothetical protein
MAFQSAIVRGAKDWYRLQQKFDRATAGFVAASIPALYGLASNAYAFYQVTSSFISKQAAGATYNVAATAVDEYVGGDAEALASLEAAEVSAGAGVDIAAGAFADTVAASATDGSISGGLAALWGALLELFSI